VSFDSAPHGLQETLAKVNDGLGDVELSTKRRVRLIVSQIVGQSKAECPIRVEIAVLSESVRIEFAGDGLALPDHPSFHHGEGNPSFPLSVLNELADRWGVDRRQAEPGIWLLLSRG
jgi:hypothetical protein